MVDVHLAARLTDAFSRNGWKTQELDDLCNAGNDLLLAMRDVHLGRSCVIPREYPLDLSADHVPLEDYSHFPLYSHERNPRMGWHSGKLLLESLPESDHGMTGHDFLRTLESKGRRFYSIHLLHLWNENLNLVPDACRDGWTLFPGTMYRSPEGGMYPDAVYVPHMLFDRGFCRARGMTRLSSRLDQRRRIACIA